MTVSIGKDQRIHFFDAMIEPVVHIEPGTKLSLQTTNSIIERMLKHPGTSDEDLMSDPDVWRPVPPEEGNPATGPIYVNGASEGDALAVEIHSIDPVGTGFSIIRSGALNGRTERLVRFFDSEQEDVFFAPGIIIPKRPMVGVIGTAPKEGRVATQSLGDHGGNMDASVVTAGATVYLPVFVPGALLSVGDVHTAMGDGEINGMGIETQAKVDIEVDVVPGMPLKRPMVETSSNWITIASHEELEKAIWLAVEDMTDFLARYLDMPIGEALLLVSLAADVRICQVVNRLRAARVELPKTVLPSQIKILL